MKILYIIDSLRSGGKERRLVSLIEGLERFEDVEMKLIILSENIHYNSVLNLNIKIHKLSRDIRKDIKIIFKFNKILKSFKPDIVHCWDNIASINFAPICKIKRIPFINSMITAAPPKLDYFSKRYISNALSYVFSDVILSNSKAGLVSFRVPKSKGYCIHNGFDMERVKVKMSKEKTRKKFNINTSSIVGMTASFTEKKDYETFVKAGEQVLKKNKDITFIAIGDGLNLSLVKSIIHKDNLKHFKFLGIQSDVESIVNIFDIGVLATYTEGISNAIMEYMAFAKPVIVTDGGGTSELIKDSITGFLIKQKDASQLAEKIMFLLSNSDKAIEMGEDGKKRIEEYFNLDRMVLQTYQLYNKNIR